MGRGSGRGNFGPLSQNPQLTCLAELTSQLGSQTGSRGGLSGAWQWAWQLSPGLPKPAVDVSGGTDVTARQPDW